VDGNYHVVRDLTIEQAETVVWLDYPLIIPLWRVIRRTIGRIVTHAELWNGNRETWRGAFFGRDSLILWILKTHRVRRREFTAVFNAPEHAHRTLIRLRSPRATAHWLKGIVSTFRSPSPL